MTKYMLIMLVMFISATQMAYGQWKICEPYPRNAAEYKARLEAVAKYLNEADALKAKVGELQAKDAQQAAKDAQQMAKDKQQADTDARLIAASKILDQRELLCNSHKPDPSYKCPQPCCNGVKKEEPKAACPPKSTPTQGYVCWKKCEKDGWYKTQDGKEWVTNCKGTFIDGIPEPEHKKLEKECKEKFPDEPLKAADELKRLKEDYKAKHGNRSGGGDGTNSGGGGNINGFNNPGHANHVANGKDDKATGVPVSK